MENYGKTIKWSTINAPKPAGGICEDYTYEDTGAEDDHTDESGAHAATILHDRVGNISFGTKLTSDAKMPLLTDTGGCKVAITGLNTGGVLFSQIVETWSLKGPRRMQATATHFLDLPNGGSNVSATMEDLDEITVDPLCFPAGKLAWGTHGLDSALGIIQSFTITQTVILTPYSEKGKIVAVTASGFEMRFAMQVLALAAAARPARGAELILASAPARFKTGNFISSASEGHRIGDGLMYDINARWSPALAGE